MDQRLVLMHQVMLGDRHRLQAYDRAMERAIRPGDVVIDVGAGTLILSLLALRHGARCVYAVEADPEMAALADRIVERNGLHGRVVLVAGDARGVRLPERAHVIVSEMMGNLGPEEEMAEIVGDVARRGLRPGGRLVPKRMVTQLQAIEFDDESWGVWRDDFWGYSLSPVQEYASPAAQLHVFNRPPKLLSEPVVVADHRLGECASSSRAPASPQTRTLTITRPGRLQAIAGFFTTTLAPGVSLSNFPGYPGCNWAVWIWPLRHSHVSPGDVVKVEIECPEDVRVAMKWRLDCRISRVGRRP